MEHTYNLTGMTCNNCIATVMDKLTKAPGIENVEINLKRGEALINMKHHITTETLQGALPEKYTIAEKKERNVFESGPIAPEAAKTELQQLFTLFLIIGYITVASILLNVDEWGTHNFMFDFMGLFYIVFSFFKMLDLKGFPGSFAMYDPVAKRIPFYGKIYPFLETALGLMFLMRFQLGVALALTVVILCLTTFGVAKILLNKKSINVHVLVQS